MKKKLSLSASLMESYLRILGVCVMLSQIVLLVLYKWVLPDNYVTEIRRVITPISVVPVLCLMWLVATYILTSCMFLFLEHKQYLNRIYWYFKNMGSKKMQKKIALQKIQKYEKVEQQKVTKTSYTPKKVQMLTSKPFCFSLEIKEYIIKPCTPIVTLNGVVIPVEIFSDNLVLCYTQQWIKPTAEKLNFSIGNKSVEVDNPYYHNPNVTNPIVWQCEGHSYERKIFLPMEYFPQVVQGTLFEFELYIGKKHQDTFRGHCDIATGFIVVKLEDRITKDLVLNKQVTLALRAGGIACKIALPKPVKITVNGVKQ